MISPTMNEGTISKPGWRRGAAMAAARLSLVFDLAERVVTQLSARSRSKVHDKTGLVSHGGTAIPLRWEEPGCAFPKYDSLAHSLWRAQEVTLFRQFIMASPPKPTADYGCGDGSFAQLVTSEVDYGIDYDPAALEAAGSRQIYKHLVNSTKDAIPLPDASLGTIFANSVLEHVDHPLDSLREMARLLRPGGRLALTIPLIDFEHQVAEWFGSGESRRMQTLYWHRNLWSEQRWRDEVSAAGFTLLEVRRFQPSSFTFYYRMLRLTGRRALGRVFPSLHEWMWRRYHTRYVGMVKASLQNPADGCNIYIVAQKN